MGNLMRNSGFRRELAAYGALGAVFTVIGFVISAEAGIVALCAALSVVLLCSLLAYRRYERMAELSSQLDGILHGSASLDLNGFSEGELSILESELSKLLITLRQQSETLKNDKVYLADSLADISHQLRTPLTSINLALAMLTDTGTDSHRRRELIRDIQQEVSKIEWLVSALLKISRLDAGTAQFSVRTVPAEELIRAAVSPLLIPMELRQVEFSSQVEGPVTVEADPSWTAEALGNVLKNCMEHTPPGGSVTVTARENGVFTQLTVRDTGPGIDSEDLPHIFQRFYRGKNAAESSAGIGLALARTIIVSQDGAITAGNDPSGGARFDIKFYKSTV